MNTSRTRSVGARLSALLAAVALALLIAVPAANQTDAGWIDPEYASAGVSALTVPSLARPTCETKRPPAILDRYFATITWAPPAGGLPAGMLYEVRITNLTANPNTTKSVFQTGVSYIFEDPPFGGRDFTATTNLSVQVFVVIPNSMATPTAAVWESLNPPASWTVTYTTIDLTRGSYVCTGN